MSEARTSPNKYIHLDVVGFTHERSVEAQSDIVAALNGIVKAGVADFTIPEDGLIFLPTGDGPCIALLNIEAVEGFPSPFDVHLRLALNILKRVEEWSANAQDDQRRFQVRFGLNEGTDNLVTDVNGDLNVAGDGINTAQRVMSLADGSQIVVRQSVFNTLRVREKYMKGSYLTLPLAKIKHDLTIQAYQFTGEGFAGLDVKLPQRFAAKKREEPELTVLVAYYFAYAIKFEDFIIKHVRGGQAGYSLVALLYMHALEAEQQSEATRFDTPTKFTAEYGKYLSEQFAYFQKLEFWVCVTLSESVEKNFLAPFYRHFAEDSFMRVYSVINETGKQKLGRERPEIWQEIVVADGSKQGS